MANNVEAVRQNIGIPTTARDLKERRAVGDGRPLLLFCVDVEEEFDWRQPFSRDAYTLEAVSALSELVTFLQPQNIVPLFLIDYPVLNHAPVQPVLKEFHDRASAIMGTQLHGWVTPPFDEELSHYNSYAGNLPKDLERQKLACLSETFEAVFNEPPKYFRSGRYGFGPNSAELLLDQGYEIDLSHFAGRDFRPDGGPCFDDIGNTPFSLREGGRSLFCIPLTTGYFGPLRRFAPKVLKTLDNGVPRAMHLRGMFEQMGIMGWTWLSPEGVRLRSAKAMTKALLAEGQQLFVLSLHSPSLIPGNTQYVRDERGKDALYHWLREYIRFFQEELGGRGSTPDEVKNIWRAE